MNKVILIGRITKDTELKYTPGNGTAVTSFNLAVDNYNSKTKENNADFIPVVLWGKAAENLSSYLVKGTQVAVSGRISTRSYEDKNGTKKFVTEVVADMFGGVKLLGGKKKEDSNNTSDNFAEGFDETPFDDGDMPFN